MPRHLQVKLLNVLQRREVQRLGTEKPIPVDVRVMAAANRDLAADVAAGRFRQDLFFRLNVVPLPIPPLRERMEDLPDLVGATMRFFRNHLGREEVEGITDEALEALLRHPWPGNMRELMNVVERAVLLCQSQRIGLADLPPEIVGGTSPAPSFPAPTGEDEASAAWLDRPLREVRAEAIATCERNYLAGLLRRTGGRVGETARLAGIAPRSLYDKMRRYGLRKEDFRS
jgi:DNA-binding NtrC family response regulator